MTWRVLILLFILVILTGCAMGGGSWSRTGRSNCLGHTRQAERESALVFFCAESP